MTLNLDLTPQAEAWLGAEAQRRGLGLVDFAQHVLEERATVPIGYSSQQTPQERIRIMDALAEKYAAGPVVPDSAFDRESIYGNRQ